MTLSPRRVAIAGIAAFFTASSAAAQSPGERVLQQMYDRWHGKTYTTLTFRQETSFPDRPSEIWWESLRVPGTLRIDIAPGDTNARVILFRNDSLYQWRGSAAPRARAYVHPLLVLYMDVFANPVKATAAKLAAQGFDLSKTRDDSWNGQAYTVVGAGPGDSTTKQFWVEKERLLVRRILETNAQGVVSDTRVLEHERVNGAWVETDIQFLQNGKEQQRERYTQVRTGVPLDDAIFDPKQNSVPSWIPSQKRSP